MNIIQCRFCKKPFVPISGNICPACLEQIDRDLITIRDYLDENKGAGIDKIAEETEVSKQHIMHLIKEERLIIDSPDGEGGGLLKCESCGAPINTGRYCEACKKNLAATISQTGASGAHKPQASSADDAFRRNRAKFGK